jgi:hypothetical protein
MYRVETEEAREVNVLIIRLSRFFVVMERTSTLLDGSPRAKSAGKATGGQVAVGKWEVRSEK